MTEQAIDLSAELRDELERNATIDPRTLPVRFSALKQFSRSAAHYHHAMTSEYEESLAMRLGTAAHALMFGQPIVVFPGKVRNGKVWDSFKAEHADTPIVNAREYAEANAMAKAVQSNALARRLLEGSVLEERIDWTWQGRACRSTPDIRNHRFVADLKTARTSEPDQFSRAAFWRHYHAQLAFYMDACLESGVAQPDEAYIIAVESAAPYPVTVLRLSDRAVEQGRKLNRLWFERLLNHEAANEWPGYAQHYVDMDLPHDEEGPALVFGEEGAP